MSRQPINTSNPAAPSNAAKKATKNATQKATKNAAPHKRTNTNWHEAASCAVQIELREYEQLLQFHSE